MLYELIPIKHFFYRPDEMATDDRVDFLVCTDQQKLLKCGVVETFKSATSLGFELDLSDSTNRHDAETERRAPGSFGVAAVLASSDECLAGGPAIARDEERSNAGAHDALG